MPTTFYGKPANESIKVHGALHEFDARDWHEYKAWVKNDRWRTINYCAYKNCILELLSLDIYSN